MHLTSDILYTILMVCWREKTGENSAAIHPEGRKVGLMSICRSQTSLGLA